MAGKGRDRNKKQREQTENNKMIDLKANRIDIICKWPKCIKLRDFQSAREIKAQLYPVSKNPTLNTG